MHGNFGKGYRRNATHMISGEIMRDFGQAAVDQLIRDYNLEERQEMSGCLLLHPLKIIRCG